MPNTKKPKMCGTCRWFVVRGDGGRVCTLLPKWEAKSSITKQCSKWRKK